MTCSGRFNGFCLVLFYYVIHKGIIEIRLNMTGYEKQVWGAEKSTYQTGKRQGLDI